MKLYLVVHHRNDNQQPYSNSWADDTQLEAITTTKKIGDLCKEARQKDQMIYIHRCSYGSDRAIICCKVKVSRIVELTKNSYFVEFADLIPLNENPPFQPHLGQNCYEAEAV
jgi:hypothetical protein